MEYGKRSSEGGAILLPSEFLTIYLVSTPVVSGVYTLVGDIKRNDRDRVVQTFLYVFVIV